MSRVFTTTLRLNLDDEADRRAWEHLQQMDRRRYRSYSKAIVAAVNELFDEQPGQQETKEDFLNRIIAVIQASLQALPLQTPPAAEPDSDDLDAALDFADSF